MPTPHTGRGKASVRDTDPMVELRVHVPRSWKHWLEGAAEARALSVGALVRQCIRDLMIRVRESST